MTKKDREIREHQSIFTDERYAKKAWKNLIAQSLEADAAILPSWSDGKGSGTSKDWIIYNEALENVKARLKAQGLDRAPMKIEVSIESNIIRAAFDNAALNIALDRTAGKVKEELNVNVGAFEELTDEELELLANARAKKGAIL